jgi:transcriptional regulator with XRE-family HTH domain
MLVFLNPPPHLCGNGGFMTLIQDKDTQNFLPDVIRTVRKFSGLKQSDIAQKLSVTQSTYSKIERGIVSTSAERWLVFASILKLNFDAPLTGLIEVESLNKPLGDNGGANCYSVRIFFVLQRILVREGYEQKVKDFLKKNNIDPDFFRMTHHFLSSDILYNFLSELSLISNPSFFVNKMNSTDRELLIGKDVLRSKSRWALLDSLATSSGYLGKSFEFKMIDNENSAKFIMSSMDQKVGHLILTLLSEAIETEIRERNLDIVIKSKSKCETLIRFDLDRLSLS